MLAVVIGTNCAAASETCARGRLPPGRFPEAALDGTLGPVETRYLARLLPLFGILGLALAGGLVLPIAGYMAGKRLIGAYEGKLGLSDYLSSIYAAAGRGDLLAWWLLLAPALVAIVWYLIIRVGRWLGTAPDED